MDEEDRSRAGCLIVILGPSGAGKDSILSDAKARLVDRNDILFVRRSITRPAHDDSEDFDAVTDDVFDKLLEGGRLCFHWQANGLRYGLPIAAADHLAAGGLAVVNGSRAAFRHMREVFPSTRAVLVRVEPSVLRERLKGRGREDDRQIEARIARAETYLDAIEPDLVIDNSATVEASGALFAEYVLAMARERGDS